MRITSPGGRSLDLDFNANSGRHAVGISRHVLDMLAVERCRALGVDVIEGARVRNIAIESSRPAVVTASSNGKARDIQGRVIVGADGHHSAVARLLSLDMPLRWPRRIGLAAHLEGYPLSGEMGEMHVGPAGYCGIAPQESGRVNVAMVVDMARFERRECSVEEFFERSMTSYPAMAERVRRARRVTPVRGVGPLARRVRRVSGNSYLLVGDAAGFFDPFTGEGIFDALRGGELAAATIASGLDVGDTSARRLASYDDDRRKAFTAKRRAAILVQAFVRSPHLLDYAVARIAVRPTVRSTLTGVMGEYRDADVVLSPHFLWKALRP
jgi:flavin-dependent dehydrogenase